MKRQTQLRGVMPYFINSSTNEWSRGVRVAACGAAGLKPTDCYCGGCGVLPSLDDIGSREEPTERRGKK
ncbi:hypothetical protein TNCT_642781 [Trichonephila clavata]|uniref:Uncharacterized protein n=1 Tax=Trichonephila clavata TaxID=2740835 RepID=A0A8X6LCW0_TRICU|nr:hypothetical protein TNCT_642781 [Trichonephila clavata]